MTHSGFTTSILKTQLFSERDMALFGLVALGIVVFFFFEIR